MILHAATLFVLLFLVTSSNAAGTPRWTPCTADTKEQMPAGYRFECCTVSMPVSHRSNSQKTISFFVKRAVHDAPGSKNIWLLAGGPGEDAREFEPEILPKHAHLLKELRPTFYMPHHRGTGDGTVVSSPTNFWKALSEASSVRASPAIPLEALNTFEAASDLVVFIKSMNEDRREKSNFFHGFSYGAYWGLYAASLGDSELVSGLVLDGVLPPAFHIHVDRQDHRLNEAIMESCESDTGGWCQQLTSRQDVLAGIKIMVDTSMHSSNYCISRFVSLFPPENRTVDDFRAALRAMLASEMCIFRDSRVSEPLVLDTRIIAIQLLTSFARCENKTAFSRLAAVVGLFYQKSGEQHMSLGRLGPPLDLGTINFSDRKPSGWSRFFQSRKDMTALESMTASKHQTGGVIPLSSSLQDELNSEPVPSADNSAINHTVFAAVVYQEFWPYDVKPDTADVIADAINGSDESSVWKAMSSGGAPELIQYRSNFPAASAPSMDLSRITMPVVVFSGTLDMHTPHFASQDLFARLPSPNKHFVSLTNQGHVLTSLLSHATDEQFNLCISTVLSGLYSSSSFTPSLECVEPLNRTSRLDWRMDRLAFLHYDFWPVQTRGLFDRLCIGTYFLWAVHPFLSLLAIACLVGVGVSFYVFFRWRRARKMAMAADCPTGDAYSEEAAIVKGKRYCSSKTTRSSSVNLPPIAGTAPQPSSSHFTRAV